MSAKRRARSHVVAKVEALDAAVKAAGYKTRSQFASALHRWPGTPSRATVLNLWIGNVVSIDFAEEISLALGVHVGSIFQLSNGREIK